MNYKELAKLSMDYANAHKAEYDAWYTARHSADTEESSGVDKKEENQHENHTG